MLVDKIRIKDLEVTAQIGVSAEERSRPQRLLVSVDLERDLAEAGRSDTESTTTAYDEVAALIQQEIAGRPRKLIEAVADDVASAILSKKMAVAITVEVKKFSVPQCRYVSVEIHREQ